MILDCPNACHRGANTLLPAGKIPVMCQQLSHLNDLNIGRCCFPELALFQSRKAGGLFDFHIGQVSLKNRAVTSFISSMRRQAVPWRRSIQAHPALLPGISRPVAPAAPPGRPVKGRGKEHIPTQTQIGYFLSSALQKPAIARQPSSLPLKIENGGRNWIRTNEGVSQQIYSLPPLATWVSYRQPSRA